MYKDIKHRLRAFQERQATLVNIDYLIVNLEGQTFGDFPDGSDFRMLHHDYGTKVFSRRSDLYYQNEKIGTYMGEARSAIISKELQQLQFENHLFYTKSLNELNKILAQFCSETCSTFKSINRCDICVDRVDTIRYYSSMFTDITSGRYLLSGRPKNMQSFMETYKGVSTLTGFTVGKRSSDKMLRVYNKSLSLKITEKPYINDYFKEYGFPLEDIWRFEYQLNATFFTDLKRQSIFDDGLTESVTWGIFNFATLVELLKVAGQGFFQLRQNTGLSQINKEREIPIFDYDQMREVMTANKTKVVKIKKLHLATTVIKKRLAKSLFREYYANFQELPYVIALNRLLEDIDLGTGKPLWNWFKNKLPFYLSEFNFKEKLIRHFDKKLFVEHQLISI